MVTINSDDPAYFGGYIAQNYSATAEALGLTVNQIVQIARHSFEASFTSEAQKQVWLTQLNEYVAQYQKTNTMLAN